MWKLTRRKFLKSSSAAAGMLGAGSAMDLWASSENAKPPIAKATFYVATNGSDSWSGKLAEPNAGKSDGPFATLQQARDAVRELNGKQVPKEEITVMGRGWKPYKGQILQTALPGSKGGKWRFRQLFFNGRRQIRARYPNFDPENPIDR